MACGEQLPAEVVDAIHNENIIKSAWNAQFERICLSKYFGTQLDPDAWQCTMVWAASLSLPLKLATAAQALKTAQQKDAVGERLIRYFSIPCKPTKSNGGRTRNLPEHAPEDWKLFKSYCIQDVETERDIRRRLEKFPILPQEWDFYHMDQPRHSDRQGTGAAGNPLQYGNVRGNDKAGIRTDRTGKSEFCISAERLAGRTRH